MNKDLLVDGKNYISAVRASKKVGYASDYIGQLCRAGKIPGKLLGRSWYVDFDALTAHKKGNKIKKSKSVDVKPQIVNKPQVKEKKVFENYLAELDKHFEKSFEPIRVKEPSIAGFSYATEYGSRLPELRKAPLAASVTAPSRSRNTLTTIVLVVFMIMSVYAVGYLRYVSVRGGSHAQLGYEATGFLSGIIDKIFGRNNKSEVAEKKEPAFGIVAIPEKDGEHASIIAKVKRAFSDEVNVSVDPEGDAGVITPVFREGGDTENYAFVMVPIKEQ